MQHSISQFLWPDERPAFKPFRWALDGGGRELITELINANGYRTMIEVGVYCGGSVMQWMDTCPGLQVFGVDRFLDDSVGQLFANNAEAYRNRIDLGGMSEAEFIAQMSSHRCLWPAMLSNTWNYRERYTPVQGESPQALIDLAGAGVTPDIVYIDADKSGVELAVVRDLWPNCHITGDDWNWEDNGNYAMRNAVVQFANQHRLGITAQYATWILSKH